MGKSLIDSNNFGAARVRRAEKKTPDTGRNQRGAGVKTLDAVARAKAERELREICASALIANLNEDGTFKS